MIEVGNYYKGIKGELLVVKATSGIFNGTFDGRVIIADKDSTQGEESLWLAEAFEPIETTQPDPTTTKDAELRLECLKLAVSNEKSQTIKMLLEDGEKIYDWITNKNHNQ